MDKKIDIAALGELLIDFTEAGFSADGRRLFEQNPGGAPANLLTAASHMGCRTAMIGKIGTDMHGRFLKDVLQREGIITDGLIEDNDYFTTLAFVAIDENGEREFSFARKPGADTRLREDELNTAILSDCRIFHFGSLSLTDEPARSSTLKAIEIAKKSGAIISYDPNYRAPLWKDQETAIETMKSVIPLVDIIKVSKEEALLLTCCNNSQINTADITGSYTENADMLLSMGPGLAAITMDSRGVLVATGKHMETVPAYPSQAVDTTGAGDSFWGVFLSELLKCGKRPSELSSGELVRCADTANAAAGLCIQKRGGIPSIPHKEDVVSFINRQA